MSLPADRELEVGDRLGPYRLDEVLGHGAMGIVFRATDGEGRTVALKVLRAQLADSDAYTARFLREARIARELEHPNLVPVVDAGEAMGRYYLAMRYVPGPPLHQALRSGPLAPDDTVRIVAAVGAGLDALHGRGLVHRDVKPSNILLDERATAIVTDFGLARGRAYTILTRPGQIMGTPHYLAPEVLSGSGPGPASDLYALGCVAFECLAGEPPFVSDNIFEVTIAHLEHEPPDLRDRRADVPEALARAVASALAKDPAERPKSARSYALSLLQALGGPAAGVRRRPQPPPSDQV